MIFNEAERAYLADQPIGRLATVNGDGTPAVRPLGFRLNEDGTIDTGGPAVRLDPVGIATSRHDPEWVSSSTT